MHNDGFATALVPVHPSLFSPEEELALVGFLAGYSGFTYEAYTLDLRQYVTWCTEHRIAVFGARRADIETSVVTSNRSGGPERRSRGGCARSPCFYRYAEEEGLHRDVTRGACPSTSTRLRIERDGPGPQRSRRATRRGRLGELATTR